MSDYTSENQLKKPISYEYLQYVIKKTVDEDTAELKKDIKELKSDIRELISSIKKQPVDVHTELAKIRHKQNYKTVVKPLIKAVCKEYFEIGKCITKQAPGQLKKAVGVVQAHIDEISENAVVALMQTYLKNAKPNDIESVKLKISEQIIPRTNILKPIDNANKKRDRDSDPDSDPDSDEKTVKKVKKSTAFPTFEEFLNSSKNKDAIKNNKANSTTTTTTTTASSSKESNDDLTKKKDSSKSKQSSDIDKMAQIPSSIELNTNINQNTLSDEECDSEIDGISTEKKTKKKKLDNTIGKKLANTTEKRTIKSKRQDKEPKENIYAKKFNEDNKRKKTAKNQL
jgi:hypothetical protein